jgi:hypothetical protein
MIGGVGPGRGSRWVIGLVVTGVLALVSAGFLVAAAGIGLARAGALDAESWEPGDYSAAATATVLDVDVEGAVDDFGGFGDVEEDDDDSVGWNSVDLQFEAPSETVVTTVEWPGDRPLPVVGDRILVAYDPEYPEWVSVSFEDLGDDGDVGTEGRAVDTDPVPVLLWGAGFGAAALAALAATVVWARRAPKPAPRPAFPAYPAYGATPYQPYPPGPYSPYQAGPYQAGPYQPAPYPPPLGPPSGPPPYPYPPPPHGQPPSPPQPSPSPPPSPPTQPPPGPDAWRSPR